MEGVVESREGEQMEEAQDHIQMERVYEAPEEQQVELIIQENPIMQVAFESFFEVDEVEATQASEERNEFMRRGVMEARFRDMFTRIRRPRIEIQQSKIRRMKLAQRRKVLEIQMVHQEEIRRVEKIHEEEISTVEPEWLIWKKMIQGEEIRSMVMDQREEIRRMKMVQLEEVRRIQMIDVQGIRRRRLMLERRLLQQVAMSVGSRRGAPSAARTALDSLPVISIQKEQVEDGSAMCSICLEILPCRQSAKMLPCLHFYHENCIFMWLESKNSCPICRHELRTDDLQYEEQRSLRL